jgi:HK97 family phage prohead protease
VRIAGYAALFGVPDGDGDVIVHGAFARTLSEQGGRPLPLLWQHRPEQAIGTVELAAEDHRGLRVIARIDNGVGRAATALRTGEATGLSFGYRARGYRRTPGGRLLHDIDLIEVSLVTHPLQSAARVHLAA